MHTESRSWSKRANGCALTKGTHPCGPAKPWTAPQPRGPLASLRHHRPLPGLHHSHVDTRSVKHSSVLFGSALSVPEVCPVPPVAVGLRACARGGRRALGRGPCGVCVGASAPVDGAESGSQTRSLAAVDGRTLRSPAWTPVVRYTLHSPVWRPPSALLPLCPRTGPEPLGALRCCGDRAQRAAAALAAVPLYKGGN